MPYAWEDCEPAFTRRLLELKKVLEVRDLNADEREEMNLMSQRIDDVTSRVGAIESTIGTEQDEAAIAADAIEDAQQAAARSTNQQPEMTSRRAVLPWLVRKETKQTRIHGMNDSKSDLAFRSWMKLGSNLATDGDLRAVQMAGVTTGNMLEIRSGVTTATIGNHLIAEGFIRAYIDELKYYCPWLNEANLIRSSTDGVIRVPRNSDAYGPNAEGSIIAELTPDTEKDPTLDEVSLANETITSGLVLVSWETLQDSAVPVDALLAKQLAQRVGRALDRLISLGSTPTTAAFPTGGFFGQSIDAAQKLKAASATAVTLKDLIALTGKMDYSYRNRPSLRWIMSLSTLTALRGETTSGSGDFVLSDPIGGSATTILGIPVVVANHCDAPAAGKTSVFLADLKSNLYVREQMNSTLRRSDDRYFEKRASAFVALGRYGMAVADRRAIAALTH